MTPIQLLSNISDDEYHWTRERIYVPHYAKPRLKPDGTVSPFDVPVPPLLDMVQCDEDAKITGRGTVRFTDEFLAEWRREEEWPFVDGPTPLTVAESHNLEKGGACPRCFTKGHDSLLVRGKVTGILAQVRRKCPCQVIRSINIHFHNPEIVPLRFQSAILRDLEPVGYPKSLLPIGRQAEIIALLRKNPTGSWLLCGDAGTGKTHFSTALYRHALEETAVANFEGKPLTSGNVLKQNTKTCLDEHVAYATKKPNDHHIHAPKIWPYNIKQMGKQGVRPCLFLDEFEKVSMTPYKMTTLFDILNAVSEVNGQIVAVMNGSYEELRQRWLRYDSTADAILRRICSEGENGGMIHFSK
jgi:hypothetical protein